MTKTYTGLSAHDSFELGTTRTMTPEGFLEAPATIARTGVQLYRARELGLDKHGMAPDQIVRLHRPAEELFNPETVSSFDGRAVINGMHETVTAANWRNLAVGDVHGPHDNGSLLDVHKLVIRDKPALDDVMGGKKFLSIGYKFDMDLTPGVNAAGDNYDGIQRNIRGNHVLITNSPRGGAACTIADSTEIPEGARLMKKIIVNGIPVEVGDSEAGIIETLQRDLETARGVKPSITLTIGNASKTITGSDALIAEITGLHAQVAEANAKVLTEAQINDLVNARVRVVGDAFKLDPEYKADGKNNRDVMVEVLTKVTAANADSKVTVDATLNGKAIGDASDDLLGAAFRTLAAGKVVSIASGADSVVAAALTARPEATRTNVLSGRDAFIARQAGAWQK